MAVLLVISKLIYVLLLKWLISISLSFDKIVLTLQCYDADWAWVGRIHVGPTSDNGSTSVSN